MTNFQTGLYQHYKGALYYAYGTAKHTESDELMVIYAPDNSNGELWVRPMAMFTETIKTSGGTTQRFRFIGEPASVA